MFAAPSILAYFIFFSFLTGLNYYIFLAESIDYFNCSLSSTPDLCTVAYYYLYSYAGGCLILISPNCGLRL